MNLKCPIPSNTRAQPSLSLSPRRRAFLCGMLAGADLHQREHVGATKAQGGADVHGQQETSAGQAPHAGAAQAQHLLDLDAGKKNLRVGECCFWVHRMMPHEPRAGRVRKVQEAPKNNFPGRSRLMTNLMTNLMTSGWTKEKAQAFQGLGLQIGGERGNIFIRLINSMHGSCHVPYHCFA